MMRSLRYLNGVLTVLAVLLTLNLWTQWQAAPGTAALPQVERAHAQGLANPDEQRMQIIDLLKQANVQLESISKRLDEPITVRLPDEQAPDGNENEDNE
jgi:hypothetical protein